MNILFAATYPERTAALVLFGTFAPILNGDGYTIGVDPVDAHDAFVRRQLQRFRGREVKTTGDGFLASFDGPARALRCAMAIADGAHALGLEIRAAVHTGECEVRGDDLGGIAVHAAARVLAIAGAGEVVASSTVKDLVAGSGLQFTDHGEHELDGLPGRWRLYRVSPQGGAAAR